jgi:hypothetical protein
MPIFLATHPDHAGEEAQGDWFLALLVFRLRRMERQLRVNTAGVHAMATRWNAVGGDLAGTVAPTGLGLSCQASAAAVDAAHADVAAFTAALAARVDGRATGVTQADTSYIAQEAVSTAALAAIFQQTIRM